jgi:8-oxo-dGTP pyrophosphatase MutT (NUDIX family)
MEPAAVRRELHARASEVRARLEDRWGSVPTRDRTVPALEHAPPAHPDDVFPWAAVCLVFRDDRVLLLRDADHDALEWEPPGGKGTTDERPANTARREVREETGVTCDVTRLLLVETLKFHYGSGEPFPVTQGVFAGQYVAGEPGTQEEAIEAVGWFDARDPPANVQYRSLVRDHVGESSAASPV